MNKVFAACIRVCLLSFALVSFASQANDPIETGTFNNKAIYGYDTVAYFTQSEAVKGDDKITSDYKGATWHFSSPEHKSLFDANPEKYAPQYGGYCSYAMSRGRFVGVDEEAFTIYNDKLYLNYSKSVREDWLEDKDGFIELADVEYPANID
jgi:YHS domain-containing protein